VSVLVRRKQLQFILFDINQTDNSSKRREKLIGLLIYFFVALLVNSFCAKNQENNVVESVVKCSLISC
jgi:hypothetical protein